MRIAVLIISLCLTAIVGLQSCTIMAGGSILHDEATSGSGAIGVLVAFLFVLGAAFVMGLPRVSEVIFAVAALFGFMAASNYPDMNIWGGVALILAAMSHFGVRELRKKQALVQPYYPPPTAPAPTNSPTSTPQS